MRVVLPVRRRIASTSFLSSSPAARFRVISPTASTAPVRLSLPEFRKPAKHERKRERRLVPGFSDLIQSAPLDHRDHVVMQTECETYGAAGQNAGSLWVHVDAGTEHPSGES
jgi:hypothetical protein